MLVITVYALLGDDIRILCTDKQGDVYFSYLNILAMFLFTAELSVASLVKVIIYQYQRKFLVTVFFV